jgi:hypothetical protein
MARHDWDDEHCVAILGQCRRVIPDHGKLLVVELVLPEEDEPFVGKVLDLLMLVLLGGRERTTAEYDTVSGCGNISWRVSSRHRLDRASWRPSPSDPSFRRYARLGFEEPEIELALI